MIRLFSHRGFVEKNNPQNSIQSLKSAYKKNFKAIEFDIWFLSQKLVLTHDKPKQFELDNLPKFSDYLIYKNDLFYWLDFKNLDAKNTEKIMKEIKKELKKNSISLQKVYFAPFITNYTKAKIIFNKIKKVFPKNPQLVAVLEDKNKVKKMIDFVNKNNIKFLSINHKLINKQLIKSISNTEIFAWTVNKKSDLLKLKKMGIKNFATDKITPSINI